MTDENEDLLRIGKWLIELSDREDVTPEERAKSLRIAAKILAKHGIPRARHERDTR